MDYFEESPEKISFVFDSMTDNQLEIVFLNRLPEPIHLQNGEKKTSIFYFGIAQDMEQLNPYFNYEAYNGNNSVYVLDDNGSKLFNSNQVELIKGHNVFSVLQNIHQPAGNWLAGYRMLEKAYRDGKAKSIGISNFEGKYMEELKTKWEIVPQFIQVEAHPYFTQKELRITLDKYGIKLMSWYPLGHGIQH
ncbi:aldo/keto reductase [Blautia wexlerae]|uniref:aldo/keto reductase n=1 Tax=Blautia wexlerae TaxID=418240 RepID=UPI0003FFF1B2|nr:aldo/keto reductase [Blautia wexlerae]